MTWCLFSLSGSHLGSLSDLLGQSPELRGVQGLGLHMPAWKPLHGRPGPELQQLSGASGLGGQSESKHQHDRTWLCWNCSGCFHLNLRCDSWYLVSHFQRVAEQIEMDGYVQTSFFNCVCFKPKYVHRKHFYLFLTVQSGKYLVNNHQWELQRSY